MVEKVNTIEGLDRKLQELDLAEKISDDALRAAFQTFTMDYPPDIPADPTSQQYRDYVFSLYSKISGRTYEIKNESSNFDISNAVSRPFPFYTGSPRTVGDQLIMIGNLIKLLSVPAGGSILEFGPGWGTTTLFLAQMGYDVTALDIDPNFADLIVARGKAIGVPIDSRVGDFFMIETLDKQFDAIVFFECFHHCSDHERLFRGFDKRVKPGGRILFGAEPISSDFPVPWGLRLDGESLWAIRNFGWLELGYQETYFVDALRRHGWECEKQNSRDIPWISYFVAKRIGEA